MSVEEHKREDVSANAAIVTISNSRAIEDDDSGRLIKELLIKNNHDVVEHVVIRDDLDEIRNKIDYLIKKENLNLIITNGGTGLSKNDVTIEAVKSLFDKKMISFNPLFSKLSYDEIGSAALMSRATAGIVDGKVIFCLPGSPKACELGMNKLIIPEIGHIIKHLRER